MRRSQPLQVVLVGAGLFGRSWGELVDRWSGSKLVAVVDASKNARSWAADALGVPTFRSLGPALAALESDAVVVATPPSTHRAVAVEALGAGRHVIVEKPVAIDLEDAVAIADAADDNHRLALVSQNYRFRSQVYALRALLAEGGLGDPAGVRITFRRDLRRAWISSRDWRGRMPHPLLLDMAIHHVDLLRAITGREVLTVDARGFPAPDGPFRYDPTIAALLDLEGGVSVSYDGTWAAPWGETSWNGDWELLGTEGRATWTGGFDDPNRGVVHVSVGDGPRRRVRLPRLAGTDRVGVLAELRRSIATGDEPAVSVRDNLRTFRTVLALVRSCEERAPVGVA